MDFESIKRLGLDHYNIDLTKSYEIYDPSTNNHTIHLYLLKDTRIYCNECGSFNCKIRGTLSYIVIAIIGNYYMSFIVEYPLSWAREI